ncbi:unnamed protein product [Periconia digitata]|uniref:feruloyl esterase n=1 Tax=Periconia digitata TaxID=1303443 RepID=A0A9W4URA7_9PLEO|nr:unnamed protein product [Periconia digitata]
MKDLLPTLLTLALALPATTSAAAIHALRAESQSDGCSKTHDWAGQTKEFKLTSDGRERNYRLHLPKNYKNGQRAPLIIAYHGSGGTPEDVEQQMRFSEAGVNADMVVAYPAGVNKNWQGPTYATKGVSDKNFTTDLIASLTSNYCIEPSSIFAAGHSNGGGFVGTLACSPGHGGQFAAFAANSGAFYTDVDGDKRCSPASKLTPFLEIHGTKDDVIPYEPTKDGRGGPLPKIPDLMDRWAVRNACDRENKDVSSPAENVQHISWTCGADSTKGAVQHYRIDGHGHSWAEAKSGVDGTKVFMDFFKQNAKK